MVCENLSNMILNLHQGNFVLPTYAVLPRLSEHPERSSFVAVCPRRGPSGHQEHTAIDKTASLSPWTAKQEVSPDQSR